MTESAAAPARLPEAEHPMRAVVLAGGLTFEREVSLSSGTQVVQELTRAGLVAGVLVLIVGGYFFVTSLGSDKPDTPPEGATASYGLRIGEEDAPKEIVVYEDFLCPFCGQPSDGHMALEVDDPDRAQNVEQEEELVKAEQRERAVSSVAS